MTALPTLFVPHGAPTFALRPGAAGAALAATAARLPRPRAIVVVSAHWETAAPAVGHCAGGGRGRTIHDFWGFPEPLYNIDYPAAGDAVVSEQVLAALATAGFVAQPAERGLDHGAWIPLRLMYPAADIPVIPLSLQHGLGPAHHYAVGRALSELPAHDILIVASGNLTHNLRDYQTAHRDKASPAYVAAFADWIAGRLATNDVDALLDYRSLAPDAARAHPSEEHLLPLFVALGAAGNAWQAERLYSGIDDHVLAMDSFALWPQQQGTQKQAQGEPN
jgi:4,5-DOPA dioxygenase extradiol